LWWKLTALMKPIAIFQHSPTGQPGAVLDVLAELSLPWTLIPVMDGAGVPNTPEPYSGVVLMGGGMGVHDGLPWMMDALRFLRHAHEAGLPIAGHCLGAQMLALALGGQVLRGEHMEIGWQRIVFEATPLVQTWLGLNPSDIAAREVFQWHEDRFTLPPGAQRLASSPVCPNQAFVWHDRHLGMQFHLEMTADLIKTLALANHARHMQELAQANPHANTQQELGQNVALRTQRMHDMLRAAYAYWARGLQ